LHKCGVLGFVFDIVRLIMLIWVLWGVLVIDRMLFFFSASS